MSGNDRCVGRNWRTRSPAAVSDQSGPADELEDCPVAALDGEQSKLRQAESLDVRAHGRAAPGALLEQLARLVALPDQVAPDAFSEAREAEPRAVGGQLSRRGVSERGHVGQPILAEK